MSSHIKHNSEFFQSYFSIISESIAQVDIGKLQKVADIFIRTERAGGKIIFVGNGGSAAMASHLSVDLTKSAGIRSINLGLRKQTCVQHMLTS